MAHANLADIYAATGRTRQAAEHYGTAVTIRPDFTQARVKYARMLERLGEHPKALRELRIAVRIDPDDAIASKTLSQILADDSETSSSLAPDEEVPAGT